MCSPVACLCLETVFFSVYRRFLDIENISILENPSSVYWKFRYIGTGMTGKVVPPNPYMIQPSL